MYLRLFTFNLWTKIPDGYKWQWIWGLLWGELGLGSISRPDHVALETPWSCFRFIFHLSRLWVCLFMYWTKVRYCNKTLSLIFFLYNLFYMFHTYGLPPILLFKIWAWQTDETFVHQLKKNMYAVSKPRPMTSPLQDPSLQSHHIVVPLVNIKM
jgi:hypothetical protein